MDILPVSPMPTLPGEAPVASPGSSAESREVVRAVKALNASEMLGEDELVFQRDRRTHRLLIQVVNRKTGAVISQVQPEYVLRLAENLNT